MVNQVDIGGIAGFVRGITANPNTRVANVVSSAAVDGYLAGAAGGFGAAANAARTGAVTATPGIQEWVLRSEQQHLQGVLAANRAQLQNARDIAAYEVRVFGNAPNPHGLGRELAQLPQDIARNEERLREIARLLGGGGG